MTAFPGSNELAPLIDEHARPGSKFARLSNSRVHWLEDGDSGEWPDVLLLSAQWLGATAYDAFAARIAQKTRLFRLDLPGHGLCSAFDDGDYSATSYARTVIDFIIDRGLTRLLVIGQSHSGTAALIAAQALPDRIAAVMLSTTSGMPREAPAKAATNDVPNAVPGELPEASAGQAWYRDRLGRLLLRDHPECWLDWLAAECRAYNELPGRAAEAAARKAMFDPTLMPMLLPAMAVPGTVIWASDSTYLAPETADRIAALWPACAPPVILSQSGHLTIPDAPGEAAALALSSLRRIG